MPLTAVRRTDGNGTRMMQKEALGGFRGVHVRGGLDKGSGMEVERKG